MEKVSAMKDAAKDLDYHSKSLKEALGKISSEGADNAIRCHNAFEVSFAKYKWLINI